MTQDEIIEMARQAGLLPLLDEDCFQTMGIKNWGRTVKVLESFAKLVADVATAKEREACAKLVEAFEPDDKDLAMAIRARGEA